MITFSTMSFIVICFGWISMIYLIVKMAISDYSHMKYLDKQIENAKHESRKRQI